MLEEELPTKVEEKLDEIIQPRWAVATRVLRRALQNTLETIVREFALWLAIVFAVIITMFAVSINAGRIYDLTTTTTRMQEISERIAASPKADSVAKSIQDLDAETRRRDSLIGTTNYGRDTDWNKTYWTCAKTVLAPCFDKNSSDMNTIIIAFMSGIIGSGIFILRSITATSFSNTNPPPPQPGSLGLDFRGFSRLLFGGIVGLLALFFIRGTKGALLSPVSGVVQVENPFGTAFMSVIAVLFFDRFFDYLDKWMAQLKPAQPETPPVANLVPPSTPAQTPPPVPPNAPSPAETP